MKLSFASHYRSAKADIRLGKTGNIVLSPEFITNHELQEKKIKLAFDSEDPDKKYAYAQVVAADVKDTDAFELRIKNNGSFIIQCKDFTTRVIDGAKKASLSYVKCIDHNGINFMQFEVTRVK